MSEILNPEKIIEKCQMIEETLESEHEVLIKVKNTMKSLKETPVEDWDVAEVNNVLSLLAMYSIDLGRLVTYYSARANSAYAYRKFRRIDEYSRIRSAVSAKSTVKDAEMYSEQNTAKEVQDEITAKFEADLLKTFYDDVQMFITVIQTRLRFMQSEWSQSNLTQ